MKCDLEIVLGTKCNNNCRFCSNKIFRKNFDSGSEILNLKNFKNILESYDSKDIGHFFLLGGEPTIFEDFIKMIKYAKASGYKKIIVITNGRMFKNNTFAQKINNLNIDLVFSIHGDNEEIHDKLTRVPGSFRQIFQGMNNLKKLGKCFNTNTVINKINYLRMPLIVEILADYNPSLMLFSLVSPTNLSNKTLQTLVPDLKDLKNVIKATIRKAQDYNQNVKFMDIPICLMEEYEEYMHEKDFKMDRKVIVKDFSDSFYLENKNKNEKFKPDSCVNCSCYKDCNGIWKGYSGFYNQKDLSPILAQVPKKKIQLWKGVLEEIPILSVLRGIKPCAKLENIQVKRIDEVKDKIMSSGLKYKLLPIHFKLDTKKNIFGHSRKENPEDYVSIFVSKDEQLLDKIIGLTFEEINATSHIEKNTATKKIGYLLGYPKCCVDSFSEFREYRDDRTINISINNKSKKKLKWRLNNLIAPYSLVDFYPCSYNCKHADTYAFKILNLIKKENKIDQLEYIGSFLKNPILYFNFNHYIIAKGNCDGNIINYTTLYSSKDFALDFMSISDVDFIKFMKILKRGNKVILDNLDNISKMWIFDSSNLIAEFDKNDKNYAGIFSKCSFFNFSN